MDVDVIYLEPNLDQVAHLKEGLGGLFKQAGLSPHIRPCVDAEAVFEACRSGMCDIFVCDLSLTPGVGEHFGGLAVIEKVKRRYPYVFVIGITGGYPDYAQVNLHDHSFDLFLQKTALLRGRFDGEPNYVNRLMRRYAPLPKMQVTISGAIRKPLGGGRCPPERSIELLVKQMFRSSLPVIEGTTPEHIELLPLGGGRSKSVVFKMREVPKRGSLPRTIDAVIKISPLEDFREETERFNKYVKWSLPYDVRVDILAVSEVDRWGAIAYSFAHCGKQGVTKTLTDIFQAGDLDDAIAIVDRIFAATSALWRPVRETAPGHSDIPDRYYRRHLDGESGRLYTLRSALTAMRKAGLIGILDKDSLEIAGKRYSNFDRVLGEQKSVHGHLSMVHGDLNSNNIIVGENNGIALIDFRDAGIGHLFEDIVALEGCVRLYWAWGSASNPLAHFHDCLASEEALIKGQALSDLNPGWAVIKHIRAMARKRFPNTDFSSYHYALCYYCFRLLRLNGLASDRVPGLLAGMIASGEEFLSAKTD